jgi:carbonic anhydrase
VQGRLTQLLVVTVAGKVVRERPSYSAYETPRSPAQPAMLKLVPALVMWCGISLSSAAQEPAKHHWDYGPTHGPTHWAEIDPEFRTCSVGHRQSPIDIQHAMKADLPPIVFDYKPSLLRIVDNGHTIVVNYAPGSYIVVGDQRYQLKQFHFHRPSEEKVHGKGFAMSAHLVHDNGSGKLVVVAILLQTGEDNALIRELWKELPKEKNRETVLDNVQIDISRILPLERRYYTFVGSLTTPPCSEDVTWIVLKHPTTISPTEVEQFSHLYPNDARSTQPLYGRTVLESK